MDICNKHVLQIKQMVIAAGPRALTREEENFKNSDSVLHIVSKLCFIVFFVFNLFKAALYIMKWNGCTLEQKEKQICILSVPSGNQELSYWK